LSKESKETSVSVAEGRGKKGVTSHCYEGGERLGDQLGLLAGATINRGGDQKKGTIFIRYI